MSQRVIKHILSDYCFVSDIAFRGYRIYDMDIKYIFIMKTITEQNPPLESIMAQELEKSSIKHLESILQLEG